MPQGKGKKKQDAKLTPKGGNASPAKSANSSRRLSTKQLAVFRELLLTKRRVLQGDVDAMEVQALKGPASSDSGELSHMPLHLADLGSDNYEQDFTLGLIESEEEEMREIDDAMRRIDDGTFGMCESCESVIPMDRLKAKPHSRLCVKCQTQFEVERESGEHER